MARQRIVFRASCPVPLWPVLDDDLSHAGEDERRAPAEQDDSVGRLKAREESPRIVQRHVAVTDRRERDRGEVGRRPHVVEHTDLKLDGRPDTDLDERYQEHGQVTTVVTSPALRAYDTGPRWCEARRW